MPRTRIKICGITRVADALAAQEAGCDAVGFVFWNRSPRCIGVNAAAAIVSELSPMISTVGVFVSPTPDEVAATCRRAGLTAAQLCGDLTEGDWGPASHDVKLIRAIGVTSGQDLRVDSTREFQDILVDNHSGDSPGGTGQTFDWAELNNLGDSVRIWLAGGLHPANVGEAVRRVRPFAVDVSTGVEERPGVKSHERIREFAAAVRAADDSR